MSISASSSCWHAPAHQALVDQAELHPFGPAAGACALAATRLFRRRSREHECEWGCRVPAPVSRTTQARNRQPRRVRAAQSRTILPARPGIARTASRSCGARLAGPRPSARGSRSSANPRPCARPGPGDFDADAGRNTCRKAVVRNAPSRPAPLFPRAHVILAEMAVPRPNVISSHCRLSRRQSPRSSSCPHGWRVHQPRATMCSDAPPAGLRQPARLGARRSREMPGPHASAIGLQASCRQVDRKSSGRTRNRGLHAGEEPEELRAGVLLQGDPMVHAR